MIILRACHKLLMKTWMTALGSCWCDVSPIVNKRKQFYNSMFSYAIEFIKLLSLSRTTMKILFSCFSKKESTNKNLKVWSKIEFGENVICFIFTLSHVWKKTIFESFKNVRFQFKLIFYLQGLIRWLLK